MQTFLPYADFDKSAQVLDYRRLGKQRIETKQILYTLLGRSSGWRNHPAVQMWRGHEAALLQYGHSMIDEWVRRGYKDTQKAAFLTEFYSVGLQEVIAPPWLGDPEFHASHRAALLEKQPEHYSRFGWQEQPVLDYYWPVTGNNAGGRR